MGNRWDGGGGDAAVAAAKTLRKGERSLKVADGKEAEVESIGSISLVLDSGFLLRLNNVVYVPSIRRNLISVSLLDEARSRCLKLMKQNQLILLRLLFHPRL